MLRGFSLLIIWHRLDPLVYKSVLDSSTNAHVKSATFSSEFFCFFRSLLAETFSHVALFGRKKVGETLNGCKS